MGREAVRWNFTGYLILRDVGFPGNLLSQMGALIGALEADDAGMLIHPILGTMLVMCERYSYSDQRTRGGYVEFDMQFIEAGAAGMQGFSDALGQLMSGAEGAENAGVSAMQSGTASLQTPKVPLPQPRPPGASA